MATRTLTVNLIGRADKLNRSFKNASRGADTMAGKMMKATRMAGLGFGALAGTAVGAAMALKPMIDKAASMEEALSKNRLLLGESSKAVEAFADTSLESFGVTNLAALQATGVFASLGDAMGMSEEASASMATTLTGLAGDLSSLHDVSVETALTALRAGLIGEAEPLRKLGILLDAATIKSKALTMGLVKNTKEALTPAIKSQAAYALILEKGAAAMGDFARTADSATNVSKILAGQWEQIQIQIGTALLPAFTAIVTHLVEEVMPSLEEFFEDPSWAAMGKLSAEALTSEFVKTSAGIFLDIAPWLINPVSAALSLGLGKLRELAVGSGDDVATAFTRGFAAAIEQFGRDNPDWYRGDWDPQASGTADGTAYGAAAALAAAGAMAPGPGFPPFGDDDGPSGFPMDPGERFPAPTIPTPLPPAGPQVPGPTIPAPTIPALPLPPAGPQVPGPTIPAPGAPVIPPAGPMVPAPTIPGPPSGFPMDPGERFPAPTAAGSELEKFLSVVGTTDWDNFLKAVASGGPPSTQITIQSTAVTGQEVVDAIGAHVDMNGPLPPHWQQSAN